MDEATANVDYETDEKIQECLRQDLKTCTVITIAHRINTILNYGRILVMDAGEIAEFDTPANLT
jgi:ABC-type multidrug transport system fused ATPase/permease subunit